MYRCRLVFWDIVAGTHHYREGEVTLLVNDACKFAIIVIPMRRWFTRESLDTAESRILNDNYTTNEYQRWIDQGDIDIPSVPRVAATGSSYILSVDIRLETMNSAYISRIQDYGDVTRGGFGGELREKGYRAERWSANAAPSTIENGLLRTGISEHVGTIRCQIKRDQRRSVPDVPK